MSDKEIPKDEYVDINKGDQLVDKITSELVTVHEVDNKLDYIVFDTSKGMKTHGMRWVQNLIDKGVLVFKKDHPYYQG